MTRRFTVRQGNTKALVVRLRGADRAPQLLPPGTPVTFTMWRTLGDRIGSTVIDHAAADVLDLGTLATKGMVSYLFTSGVSSGIARGVYYAQFDGVIGGQPLTFPDEDEQTVDPLLVHVT